MNTTFDLDAVSSIRLLVPMKLALRYLPGSEVYVYQHRNAAYRVVRQVPVENKLSTQVWLELEKVTSGVVA